MGGRLLRCAFGETLNGCAKQRQRNAEEQVSLHDASPFWPMFLVDFLCGRTIEHVPDGGIRVVGAAAHGATEPRTSVEIRGALDDDVATHAGPSIAKDHDAVTWDLLHGLANLYWQAARGVVRTTIAVTCLLASIHAHLRRFFWSDIGGSVVTLIACRESNAAVRVWHF